MLGSVIGLQAALQHSPFAFVVYSGVAAFFVHLLSLMYQMLNSVISMQAWLRLSLYAFVV